jgi:hypothetical protein
MTRDDGDDIFPELGFKSRTGKRISRKEAQSEVETEMRQEMGLDIPELPEGAKPKEAEVEPPTPKKFKFAGQEYDTAEAAEQSFKSLQGMFKPLNERVSKAESLAQQAVESAHSWRNRALELEKGVSPTPPGQVPPGSNAVKGSQPTTPKTAQQELQAVMENVDGEMFETLAREKGLPLAGRYLAAQVLASVNDQMLPALRESILAEIRPQLDPVTQSIEFQQQTEQVGTIFDNVSQFRNPDGAVAFPELSSAEETQEVAELWSTMKSAEPTMQSLIQAIALYRLYRGARGTSSTSTPPVNVTPPPNVLPRSQPMEAGGSVAAPGSTRAGAMTEDQRFARGLDDVDLVDRTLGFAVRRRR